MSVDNLPALRASNALAVIPPATTQPQPIHNRLSEDYLLLAFVAAVLASSAAWSHMWAATAGIGTASGVLAAIGLRHRRREHGT